MNLKTSFFNKSLFKSDMKRYWWVGVIETLLLFVVSVLPVYERCRRAIENRDLLWNCNPEWIVDGVFLIPIIFSLGVSVLLFTYMHFTASVSTLHSIPLRRGTIFSTKVISGIILTVTPIVINAIAFLCIIINPEYAVFYSFSDIGKWLIIGTIYTLVIFSLTTIVNMMTGNPIGTLVFTCGFAVLPVIFIGFFQSFCSMEIFGYAEDSVADILEHIYISEENILKPEYTIVYILFIVLFTLGAYALYRKRKLESYGEVIAFTWLKPVFIAIISILTSMLSYFYFIGMLEKSGLFWILPFGIIGTVIAWMISKKSISIKGILKPVLIYLTAAVCFIGIINFDLTGYERRVPAISDIESVRIVHDNTTHKIWYNREYVEYKNPGEISPYFTDGEDIKNVISLHKYLIKTEDREFESRAQIIPLEYKLKNGKTLKRRYTVSLEDDSKLLKALYETEQVRANRFNIINGGKREFINVRINDRRFSNSTFSVLYPDNQYMQKLIDALKQDLTEISYEEMNLRTATSISISVEYKNEYVFEKEISDERFENMGTDGESYDILQSFENTIAVLTEMGLYDALPKASDIESANVYTWETKVGEAATVSSYEKYAHEDEGVEVTDTEKISELYSLYDNMIEEINYTNYETCKNIRIGYKLKNGHAFEVSCSYDEDKIPTELAEYFE